MSTAMIYQGRNDAGFRKDEIHLSAGLQLLPDTAIDTHFVTRGRIVRMAQIIAADPGCLGIGLEDAAAVLVTAGRELEVLGNGMVVLVDGLDCTGNTLPHVRPGEVFSIRNLRVHLLARRTLLHTCANDQCAIGVSVALALISRGMRAFPWCHASACRPRFEQWSGCCTKCYSVATSWSGITNRAALSRPGPGWDKWRPMPLRLTRCCAS